jgi:hypothetical protein
MESRIDALSLAEGILGVLLATAGAVLALSWMFGKWHRRRGDGQQPPFVGMIAPAQHHQSPPGR